MKVLEFVRSYLPPDPVIVDAGAYNGRESKMMAEYWPQGHVHSFEPVPELYGKLEKTTQSYANITCYQKALADDNGRAKFYLSAMKYDPSSVSQSSSLLPPKEHLDYAPGVLFTRSIEVETVTLDTWAKEAGVDQVDFF